MAKKRVSDAEFERQYEAAVKRGRARDRGPRAVAASYDDKDNCIVLEFSTGASVEIPCVLLDELNGAKPEEVAEVELSPQGTALHWEDLDVDISVVGSVAVAIGQRTWMSAMGSVGGRATSEAKASAARANGMKGGRPAVDRDARAAGYAAGRVTKGGAKKSGVRRVFSGAKGGLKKGALKRGAGSSKSGGMKGGSKW